MESREQGFGSRGHEKRNSRRAAMWAFAVLSIPLALVPPQILLSTAEPTPKLAAAIAAPTVSNPSAQDLAAPERRIVVSIPDRKLAVMEGGRVSKVYRVAVGTKASPSPTGKFHIVNKAAAPVYRHHGKVIAAGAANPLGSRWLGLDAPHYGIHGTNEPASIGRAASHGCIRMDAKDVQELYAMAKVGDAVEIHAERDEELARIFGTNEEQGE